MSETYFNQDIRKERKDTIKNEISEYLKQGIVAGFTKKGKRWSLDLEE